MFLGGADIWTVSEGCGRSCRAVVFIGVYGVVHSCIRALGVSLFGHTPMLLAKCVTNVFGMSSSERTPSSLLERRRARALLYNIIAFWDNVR